MKEDERLCINAEKRSSADCALELYLQHPDNTHVAALCYAQQLYQLDDAIDDLRDIPRTT